MLFSPLDSFSLPISLRVRKNRTGIGTKPVFRQTIIPSRAALRPRAQAEAEPQERAAATGKSGQKVSERRSVQTLSRFKLAPGSREIEIQDTRAKSQTQEQDQVSDPRRHPFCGPECVLLWFVCFLRALAKKRVPPKYPFKVK